MRLTELCIKQPVLAIVFNLVLVVLGVVGFLRLDLRFFPQIAAPLMSIETDYVGASAQLMENNVTTILEDAIANVPNIDAINSSSSMGRSNISIRFRIGDDFDRLVNAVRDQVSSARAKLPVNSELPIITVGGSADPVLNVDFLDASKQPADIRDYVERNVLPELRLLPDVGSITVTGASDYAMRIWLDSGKMTALGVTVTDIQNALQSNNIDFPAGQIQDPSRNYSIISDTRLKTPQDFANIIIRQDNNRTIRFKDVADVQLGYQSLQDAPMRIDGKPAIDLAIAPLLGANAIVVANDVKKSLAIIKKRLPETMHLTISYDASIFLKAAIKDTFMAVLEAIALVIIVVYLFLGSLRAASIPIVTIPVCIIAVFGVMYLLGFTINVMTLLAVVLAIGLVVDDAIVMLENIHRHIEEGESPVTAAFVGSKEIAFPVIAMTITLAAVYAPIGFAQGFTAGIFKEFAFTLAGAVLISGFVALTLSPMMCAKILQPKNMDKRFVIYLDQLFDKLSNHYQRYLTKILKQREIIIIILLVLAVLGYFIFKLLPAEFVPKEDVGWIQGTITAPTGSSLDYTDKYTRQMEAMFSQVPEAKDNIALVSAGSATTILTLKPWGERQLTTQEIVDELNPKLAKIIGADAYVSVPDPIQYYLGGHDFAINLMTIGNYGELAEKTEQLYKLLKAYPGLTQVTSGFKYDSQQYSITVNRDLAAVLGVNIQDIASTVSAMLGGAHITDVESGTRSYQVIVQMQKQDLQNFSGINKLYVRSQSGQMIPLSTLITLTPNIGQPSLGHYNRMRSSNITAQLMPGYSISQAVNYAVKILPQVLTTNITYAFDGKAQQYIESQGNLTSIFVLALIFIYLVLSAQFGSFIDPFVILLSVPLSIVGALLALKLGGGTLNLYSQIGLVTLIGMITKHGILITQFANQLREQGLELYEALIKASAIRLRPILMTTIAMVFGALPLALATGPGAVDRHQIGWVIVGGLLFGTFFSLIVVPVAYSYLAKFKRFS